MRNYMAAKHRVGRRGFAGLGIIFSSIMSLLVYTEAHALPIVFEFGFGGTVSYNGSSNPLVTTDGIVTSVTNGGASIGISGGDLDFSTGNYVSGSATATGFQNQYAGGGSLTINGDIGSGSVLLLSGNFSGASVFDCCTGTVSSFSGLLSISHLNSTVASALGFNLPATGGSIAQVQIFFGGPAPTVAGAAFSGIQGGGGMTVADTASVPEPSAVLLLGLGLIAMAAHRVMIRRKGIDFSF